MRSLSPEMATSSATAGREKFSRNKRKFRQDLPFPSHGSSDEKNCCGNSLSSEGENWMPEPRSVEDVTLKSCFTDSSSRKEVDGRITTSISNIETSRSFHKDQLKLMRLRSGQARVVQSAGPGMDGIPEESGDAQSKTSEEDDEFYELEEVDWDDCTEGELEDLLVKSLGSVYNEAINKIVASGHGAEEALTAVLKHGRCHGGKDAFSNIVENSLAYLTSEKSYVFVGNDHNFSDLKELQKYSLTEMVILLRENRPLLSKGDAMWCLLMCDMNVPQACVMDDSALPPICKDPFPGPPGHLAGHAGVGPSSCLALLPPGESALSTSLNPRSSNARSLHPPAATGVNTAPLSVPSSISLLPAPKSPKSPAQLLSVSTPDVSLLSLLDSIPDPVSRVLLDETPSSLEESTSGEDSLKVTNHVTTDDCSSSEVDDADDDVEEIVGLTNSAVIPALVSLKLDERVDQKQEFNKDSDRNCTILFLEKCEPAYETTAPSDVTGSLTETTKAKDLDSGLNIRRTGPLQVGDEGEAPESQPSTADTGAVPVECVNPPAKAGTNDVFQNVSNCLRCENATLVADRRGPMSSSVQFGTVHEPTSKCLSADTERTSSVDLPLISGEMSQALSYAVQKTDSKFVSRETSASTVTQFFKKETSSGKDQMEDQKDEMITKLVNRSKELETQLQERTDWAKRKVMQAARRLSNDLQELKALRIEREEALRLKKDKQALEDSTTKKFSDLDTALRKVKGQLDEANKFVKKLETENAEIRAEMQAAKLSAAEAQSSCQEMAKREKKSIKRAQAWEKQKSKLQEELSEEKRKITALQQQLTLAKERQQQAEVRWRQEEKAKEDAFFRLNHEKRAREQSETAAKKREESLRRKAESNYQRHREDIQRLESEIAQFRISAEAAHLATSRWGTGVSVTPHMMELSSLQALKESNNQLARELAELQDMARRDIHRERECVMCMCEEMSVVFLPCAHQVVCVKCNDLHEKQGMRDCPSCRTPIKHRIRVYGVST